MTHPSSYMKASVLTEEQILIFASLVGIRLTLNIASWSLIRTIVSAVSPEITRNMKF